MLFRLICGAVTGKDLYGNQSKHSGVIEPLESRRMLTIAGTPDTSFGTIGNGTSTIDLGFVSLTVHDVAVQSDGKVVVAGTAKLGPETQMAVARFNADGTPDTVFGGNNTGVAFLGGKDADAVAVEPDGSIIVVGTDESFEQLLQVSILGHRLDATGKITGTFDYDFNTVDDIRPTLPTDIVIQNDGKIVVVGEFETVEDNGDIDNQDFFAIRFNDDQTMFPDDSFDGDGIVSVDFGHLEAATAATIDYSGTPATNPHYGSIVMVGDSRTGFAPSDPVQMAIARIKPNGSLDSTFDGDGKLTMPFRSGENYSTATGVVVQSTGNYVISGTSGPSLQSTKVALLRVFADGSVDTSFGSDGDGSEELGDAGTFEGATDMIIGQTGKLLVSGPGTIYCLDVDGNLDPLFGGGDGMVTSNVGVTAMALAPNGRFVVASGEKTFAVERLFDRAPTIALAPLDPNASEAGPDQASFFVTRSERLPYPTTVYFKVTGTATAFSNFPTDQVDYSVSGLNDFHQFTTPYVTIPAGETFAIISLTPFDDSKIEPTETATFSIIPQDPGMIDLVDPTSETINIADNDHQISGTVFDDANGNGAFELGESGISGRGVYLDTNNNSVLDSGETETFTDANGRYAFGNLAAGTYHVREVLPGGVRRTSPSPANSFTVTLAPGDVVDNLNFGNTTSVGVTGNVFIDNDGDGFKDASDIGYNSAIVYDDVNNDQAFETGEPFTASNAAGDYSLNLAPNVGHHIRVSLPPNYRQTLPLNNASYDITLGSGQTASGKDFGIRLNTIAATSTSIVGSVYDDLDGDGTRDLSNPTEPNLSGWTVYLDLNKNGKMDSTDPRQVTDGDGNFAFTGLTPGVSYRVREIVPRGWKQTTANPADVVLANNEVRTVTFGDRLTAPILASGYLVVQGTSASDSIKIDSPKSGQIKVTMNKANLGTFNVSGGVIVLGYDGNDSISATAAVTKTVIVFGGAGNDSISGGSGADILLGESGNDSTSGNKGRDLLIGGAGADKLDGGADDDLLIAGSTSLDENLEGLSAILTEWTSTRSYTDRATDIQTGSGATAGFYFDDTTVIDDAAKDVLTGGSGRDLFYRNTNAGVLDTTSDKAADELAVEIN
jgi:uncharacterized delta-60 repeat protein